MSEESKVAGGWVCEYTLQVELNGWLPRGPIEKGTIESIADYLNFTRGFDFTAIMPL